MSRHTPVLRDGPRKAITELDLSLRAINEADLSLALSQDLLRCQSLDNSHRSSAAGALRQRGFARGTRCACAG
jgi:hypothetical protein